MQICFISRQICWRGWGTKKCKSAYLTWIFAGVKKVKICFISLMICWRTLAYAQRRVGAPSVGSAWPGVGSKPRGAAKEGSGVYAAHPNPHRAHTAPVSVLLKRTPILEWDYRNYINHWKSLVKQCSYIDIFTPNSCFQRQGNCKTVTF